MLGQILLSISAASLMTGPFLFDFNETHVLNPRWPPHARFHNGQTMSMGLCLGLATLYYTFRAPPTSTSKKTDNKVGLKDDDYFTAMIFGSIYWITGLSAILYPGSLAIDPEFGEGFPQLGIFLGTLGLAVAGWACETKLRR